MTESGGAPLTYEWRFNGRELPGAINPNLTVSTITPIDLGPDEVVVRDKAGAAASKPILLASRWTELVVFGASWEMQGCEGFAWPDYLANRLGVRLRNYAQPGANSSQVRSQINSYLRSCTPTTNTLIGHWGGGSFHDLRGGLSAERAASNRLANVRLLVNAGARNFLMPTMPPPEMVPFLVARFPKFTSEQVIAFDARLSEGLKALQAEHSLAIYRPDLFAFFRSIRENPAAYGFSAPLGSDFSCDGAHFTTEVHRLISQEFYRSLTSSPRLEDAGK